MYPTQKALAYLGLGEYGPASSSLAEENASEDSAFTRSLKCFGEGMLQLQLMAYQDAEKAFTQVIDQSNTVGRAWLRLWAEANRVRALLAQNRIDAISMAWANVDLEGTATTLLAEVPELMGEVALAQGQLDDAMSHAEHGLAQAIQHGWKPCELACLELKMRILLKLQRDKEASALGSEAGLRATRMRHRPLAWRILDLESQALERQGLADASQEKAASAASILREIIAGLDPTERHQAFASNPRVVEVIQRGNGGA